MFFDDERNLLDVDLLDDARRRVGRLQAMTTGRTAFQNIVMATRQHFGREQSPLMPYMAGLTAGLTFVVRGPVRRRWLRWLDDIRGRRLRGSRRILLGGSDFGLEFEVVGLKLDVASLKRFKLPLHLEHLQLLGIQLALQSLQQILQVLAVSTGSDDCTFHGRVSLWNAAGGGNPPERLPGNYPTGPGSEFNKLKKYSERHFG